MQVTVPERRGRWHLVRGSEQEPGEGGTGLSLGRGLQRKGGRWGKCRSIVQTGGGGQVLRNLLWVEPQGTGRGGKQIQAGGWGQQ